LELGEADGIVLRRLSGMEAILIGCSSAFVMSIVLDHEHELHRTTTIRR
jgi:uncharacterized membrane protein (DUF4010 family)